MNEQQRKFNDIFRKVMNLGTVSPIEDLRQGQLPGWDSLRHAELLIRLQKELGLRFTAKDAVALTSVRQFTDFIDRHVAG
jgi:acyl carrier protein